MMRTLISVAFFCVTTVASPGKRCSGIRKLVINTECRVCKQSRLHTRHSVFITNFRIPEHLFPGLATVVTQKKATLISVLIISHKHASFACGQGLGSMKTESTG